MLQLGSSLFKTMVAVVTLIVPQMAIAEEITCKGTLGNITVSNIRVPQGRTCILKGTTIRGNVVVNNGAILKAVGVKVNGRIQTVGTAFLEINSTSIIRGGIVQSD